MRITLMHKQTNRKCFLNFTQITGDRQHITDIDDTLIRS